MPRFISLIRFTDSGVKAVKDSIGRAHAFKEACTKAGVQVDGQYWTVGQYDGVLIVSASDERKVLHFLTELASAGHVRTETMPAFSDSEFASIVH